MRDEGNGKLIFAPNAVPTAMVPLTEHKALQLKWGVAEGGPGAMFVKYGEGDFNIITNYDLARMYEKGHDPASNAMLESVKAKVSEAFNGLKSAGGAQVPQENGKQVWKFESSNIEQVCKSSAKAASELGIKLEIKFGGESFTVNPGMTAPEVAFELFSRQTASELARSGNIESELGKPRQSSTGELKVGADRMTAQDLEKLSNLAREQAQSTDPAKQQEGKQTLSEIERARKGDSHAARLVMGKWKGIATAVLGAAGLATGLLPGEAQANDFHRLAISGR